MLKTLIKTLSTSEKKAFTLCMEKRNKRNIGSNIELFKAFDSGNPAIIRASIGQNAFNVAKKRLLDRLLDFLGNRVFEQEVSSEIQVLKYLVLARRMLAHDQLTIGIKTLRKAEKKAIELQHYAILLEIYDTALHYSQSFSSDEFQALMEKSQENLKKMQDQHALSMAHAKIQSYFRSTEFGQHRGEVRLHSIVAQAYTEFGIPSDQLNNFQSLYQLAQIADVTAFEQKNYFLVDLYFADRIDELTGTALDGERNLIYHIDVLYLVANIYFRQREFEKSLDYLHRMKTQMERFGGKFYASRNVQFTTLLALNHNFIGDYKQSEEALDTLFTQNHPSQDLLNPKLVRAMIHFQQGELDAAQRILSTFQHQDSWYQQRVGLDWLLNRRYIEILLHIELGNIDFVDSRISSLTRKYGDLFQQENYLAIRPFLKLLHQYNREPHLVSSEKFKKTVEKTIPWREHGEEDIFLMCFYAWLKARMERRELYETTLELVQTRYDL